MAQEGDRLPSASGQPQIDERVMLESSIPQGEVQPVAEVYGRENGGHLQPQYHPYSNLLNKGNGHVVHNASDASDGLSPSNTVAAATGRVPVQECGSPSDAQSNTQNEVSPELAISPRNDTIAREKAAIAHPLPCMNPAVDPDHVSAQQCHDASAPGWTSSGVRSPLQSSSESQFQSREQSQSWKADLHESSTGHTTDSQDQRDGGYDDRHTANSQDLRDGGYNESGASAPSSSSRASSSGGSQPSHNSGQQEMGGDGVDGAQTRDQSPSAASYAGSSSTAPGSASSRSHTSERSDRTGAPHSHTASRNQSPPAPRTAATATSTAHGLQTRAAGVDTARRDPNKPATAPAASTQNSAPEVSHSASTGEQQQKQRKRNQHEEDDEEPYSEGKSALVKAQFDAFNWLETSGNDLRLCDAKDLARQLYQMDCLNMKQMMKISAEKNSIACRELLLQECKTPLGEEGFQQFLLAMWNTKYRLNQRIAFEIRQKLPKRIGIVWSEKYECMSRY
eukprot:scpid43008/ scgid2230/ 